MRADVQQLIDRRRRVPVAEYHGMIADGVLRSDDHVELLDGRVRPVSPQGQSHAILIQELARLFTLAAPNRLRVRTQLPLTILGDNEPEPDLAIVETELVFGVQGHPGQAELVIEVSGSSLPRDRLYKRDLYAAAGIPEYWIVNLDELTVEICRDPRPAHRTYAAREQFAADARISCLALPKLMFALKDLLPATKVD